jgi:hypothetical protein
MIFDHTMKVYAMLALAIIITPIAYNISAIDTQVPIVNFVVAIFKTVDIRVAVIKIVNTSGTPVNVRVILTIVVFPCFYTVAL